MYFIIALGSEYNKTYRAGGNGHILQGYELNFVPEIDSWASGEYRRHSRGRSLCDEALAPLTLILGPLRCNPCRATRIF